MYRIKHCSTLFAFVALVWLAGTTFEALGQTPNVRAWGGNSQGELGNGVDSLTASRAIPGQVSGLNGVVAVMGGQSYSLALKGNGTVWSWGDNAYGELGNGSYTNSSVPAQLNGLTGIVKIAGSAQYTVALKIDGTVWSWGYALGEFDVGLNGNAPVQVGGLAGVSEIAAGSGHGLAVKSDGTVWAWGYNYFGTLGNGTNTDSDVPVQVSGLAGVSAVAAGAAHSLALKSDGTVWAWGDNTYWQLGTGADTSSNVPVQVSGLTEVVAISAAGDSSLALRSDGTVWAWGTGAPIGAGLVPAQVTGLTGVLAIATGDHRLALKGDGTVWAWGDNSFGELGDGSYTNSLAPVLVGGVAGVIAVSGSWIHSLAVKSDGTVWAWGDNTYGELGNGNSADSNVALPVNGLAGAVALAGGSAHSLALKSDGTVSSWGDNYWGELGNGSNANSNVPMPVDTLTGAVAIAGGDHYSLALKSDGTVWAWGDNYYGELGNGSNANSSVPVQASGLAGVVTVAAGEHHSLALKSDGTVWAWGDNGFGELGNGTNASSNVPVEVNGLAGAVGIGAGSLHSLALRSDGTVWAWGWNVELGNGTNANSSVPVEVSGLTGAVAVAGGAGYSLALKNDGTAWTWGVSLLGIYPNEFTSSNLPVPIGGLSDVVAFAAGQGGQEDRADSFHSLALRSDGTVWAWGYNLTGELGNGSNLSSNVPVQVNGLAGVVAIASGGQHSLAALAEGIPELALSPGSLSFGTIAQSDAQTITLTNSGSAPVTINSVLLAGINSGDFSIPGACAGASISPAQNCRLTVTFTPTAQGSRTAAILITANVPGSPILVPLSGTGTPTTCSYSLTPTTLSVASSGGAPSVTIQTGAACAWTVSSLPSWITASANTGSGSTTLTFTVAANSGPPRAAQFTVAGTAVTVNQASDVLLVNTGGVVDGASFTAPVVPGSIAAIFGNFLLPAPVGVSAFPIPTNLGGLSLQFGDGPLAPLFYANVGQVNAQVPWELAGQSQTTITATINGQTSASQTVGLATYAPGIFAINSEGTGPGAIQDSNFHLVDASNPAIPGQTTILIYCTGLGPVSSNQPATGAPASLTNLAHTSSPVTATIGGVSANVTFSGLAPGSVGLYQVNVAVPAAVVTNSAAPVAISIGSVQSNTVTIPVE
jgi:uncharacterized protein (TIGR03437 family)